MSWDKVKISDLVEEYSVRGKDVQKSEKLEFYGVSNELGITNAKYSANDKHEDYKVIKKGCFAYNPYRINVGSIGLYDLDEKGLVSPAYVVFKTKPKSILPELLLKFLKSEEGLRQIKLYARGTVRQALRFDDLCKIELSIPDYNEQELLYHKLNSTQTKGELLINEFSYQQNLISKLRQQILQDAIEGKLVPQDPKDEPASVLLQKIKAEKEKLINEKKLKKSKPLPPIKNEEIPFDNPKNWVWCRLDDICMKITDGTHNSPPNGEKGKYKYITAKNIKESGIDLSELTYVSADVHSVIFSRCDPIKGDILFIKDGATTGILTINNLDEPFSMLSSVALIRPFKNVYNKFLMYAMRSNYYYNNTRNDMFGVAITRVTLTKIQYSMIPVPPLIEQKRIVKKIEELLKVCDKLEKEVKQNQNLTQQLLQSALKEALEPKVN